MIRVPEILRRCACRWTSKVSEPGWVLEQAHPGCLTDHDKKEGNEKDGEFAEVTGFGACESDEYPKFGAEEELND